jgi:GntR family transcriptional regulator, transcriptional repressor for pyruvate dehydrogenase complex
MSPASPDPHESLQAVRRSHVADDVFEQLVAAILRGEMPPGTSVPPERVLAERFVTSRIVARQAIHRLHELGLVRVRQGGATIVLDPKEADDLRVLELAYKLDPGAGSPVLDPRHMLEKQTLQGLALVEIAARCAGKAELEGLAELTESFAASRLRETDYVAFEERFWRALAKAGGNSILIMEVGWWYRVLSGQPRPEARVPSPLATRVAFYRELARRLAKGENAVAFYLEALKPLLEAIRHQPKIPKRSPQARLKTSKPRSPR